MTNLASYRTGQRDPRDPDNGGCAFCDNDFPAEQRLGRTGDLNIISPLGQVVPGSLVAFHLPPEGPADPCFAVAAGRHAPDIEEFERVADAFTRSLGGRVTVFYEQGRAGGGQLVDRTGFLHHAHHCSWPVPVDVVAVVRALAPGMEIIALDDLSQLGAASGGRPYVLARTYVDGRCADSRLVLPVSEPAWTALENSRLKFPLAEQLGHGDFRDWRTRFPEHTSRTARKFRAFAETMVPP